MKNEPRDFESARRQAEKQLSRYPWLHSAELHIFGGRWSMQHLPFRFSLVRRLPGNPLGRIAAEDIRDWAAIREWSLAIASQIRPAA